MREAWTDERLDDLVRVTDRSFAQVDARFDRVEGDIRDLRGDMDSRFNRLDARFDHLESRFDSMQRMTLAAYLTAVVGLIVTQL